MVGGHIFEKKRREIRFSEARGLVVDSARSTVLALKSVYRLSLVDSIPSDL